MKNKEFGEILKKCFGKEKDDRYHAIAMLVIYGVFILILVLMIRLGGSTSSNESLDNSTTPSPSPAVTDTPSTSEDSNLNNNVSGNDINYSYSYTITYNGISEVYLGKKVDEKEKFTLVKDGILTDYAILGDNYLILDNGIYRITESPSSFFKYCDIEKILLLIENEIPTENGNIVKYSLSNSDLALSFKDVITVDNEISNLVTLMIENNSLKSIDLDFSNYISSVLGSIDTLNIHMEFVDVGTTEDFEIKVS